MRFLLFCCLQGSIATLAYHPAFCQSPPERSTVYAGTSEQEVRFATGVYAPNASMTIEAWVYREDQDNCETIISQDFTQSFWLGFCGGRLRFYRSGGSFADANQNVPAQRWTHVAASYAAGSNTVRFYIDGASAGIFTLAHEGGGHDLPVYLGSDPNRLFFHYNFHGALDEVRIWSVARTQAQIAANRYVQLTPSTGGPGLVAVFPSGGAYERVGDQNAVSVIDSVPQVAGILPRDLVIPIVPVAPTVDGRIFPVEYEGAEEMVIRFRRDGVSGIDTVAKLVAANPGGGDDCRIFVGIRGIENLGGTDSSFLAFAWGPPPSGRTAPGPGDRRLTFDPFSIFSMVGDGTSWVSAPIPSAEGDYAFCDGEFAPPCVEFGSDIVSRSEGASLMLWHSRTLDFSYRSPFDATIGNPSSWAKVTFGSPAGTSSEVTVRARAIEPMDGDDIPLAGVPVELISTGPVVVASGTTDSTGWVTLNATVHRGEELRVRFVPPATWNSLGVEAVPGTGTLPTWTTTVEAEFPGCGEESCDYAQLIYRAEVVPEDPISVTGFVPEDIHGNPVETVFPRVRVRDSPVKEVGPGPERIRIDGENFHARMRVWLDRCRFPPFGVGNPWETPNCEEHHFHRLPLVAISPDRRSAWVSWEPPADWLHEEPDLLVQDPVVRPDVVHWNNAGQVEITMPPYPMLHGFEFVNERDGTQADAFSGVYQWKAYDCWTPVGVFPPSDTCLGCRVPNPVYWTFYLTVFTPWVELMTGSCMGMSAASLLMARGELSPESFTSGAHYAFGLPAAGPDP